MNTTVNAMSPASRVWVYHSSRPFTDQEKLGLTEDLQTFATQWAAHQIPLTADALILHDRFIVMMVDENLIGASGCSIDASVHFLQKLAQKYNLDLFNRMLFAALIDGEIKSISKPEFVQLYQDKEINDQTMVFDTLVPTKEKLEDEFVKPLGESWHRRMVS